MWRDGEGQKARPSFTPLGKDVWLHADSRRGSATELIGRRRYVRFMDRIYLPVPPEDLTVEQIKAISRYREGLILNGPGLAYRDRVRNLVKAVVADVGRGNLLEFGCGKFPLACEVLLADYLGIDPDDEAVCHNLAKRIACRLAIDSTDRALGQFDLVVSLFAFHFRVPNASLDVIASATAPDAICCYNVVTKNVAVRNAVAERLAERGMRFVFVPLDRLGAHDTFVIAAREGGLERAERVLRTVAAWVEEHAARRRAGSVGGIENTSMTAHTSHKGVSLMMRADTITGNIALVPRAARFRSA